MCWWTFLAATDRSDSYAKKIETVKSITIAMLMGLFWLSAFGSVCVVSLMYFEYHIKACFTVDVMTYVNLNQSEQNFMANSLFEKSVCLLIDPYNVEMKTKSSFENSKSTLTPNVVTNAVLISNLLNAYMGLVFITGPMVVLGPRIGAVSLTLSGSLLIVTMSLYVIPFVRLMTQNQTSLTAELRHYFEADESKEFGLISYDNGRTFDLLQPFRTGFVKSKITVVSDSNLLICCGVTIGQWLAFYLVYVFMLLCPKKQNSAWIKLDVVVDDDVY
ncbi:unnamed protein product [Clavelina lepadiformis]|uniref:ABC transmembrane type-1 domain-containing protein n=2 Tax=Clavelina lepadiformis TaxID=159417 RepID=A0ABP0FQZ9_CLALP